MSLRRISPFICILSRTISVSSASSCKKSIKPIGEEVIVPREKLSGVQKRTIQEEIYERIRTEDPDDMDALDRSMTTSMETSYDIYRVRTVAEYFSKEKEKNWGSFKRIIKEYKAGEIPHQEIGSIDFIYGALKKLKEFGLHKDINAYKALMDIFPKGKMVPENSLQRGLFYYYKYQWAAIEILDAMDENYLMPDEEMVQLVIAIFGEYSKPIAKLGRMIYWYSKARYNDPYPMPTHLPESPKELAIIGLRRMSVDLNTKISVFSTESVPESKEKTWVMSAMAPKQIEILNSLDETLYIDGPHWCWLKEYPISYFILRTAPLVKNDEPEEDFEDLRNLPLYTYGGISKEEHLKKQRELHYANEGIILSMIATGTSTPDSLLSWVRIMQYHLPKLKELSIVFQLKRPETTVYEYIPEPVSDDKFTIGIDKVNHLKERRHSTMNATEVQLLRIEDEAEDAEIEAYIENDDSKQSISPE